MCDKTGSLEKELLKLQNALIEQAVDEAKVKIEIEDLSERAYFYEELYNKMRSETYELEIKLNDVSKEKDKLNEKYLSRESSNVNNLGSISLIKIVFNRLKEKLVRGKNESN